MSKFDSASFARRLSSAELSPQLALNLFKLVDEALDCLRWGAPSLTAHARGAALAALPLVLHVCQVLLVLRVAPAHL